MYQINSTDSNYAAKVSSFLGYVPAIEDADWDAVEKVNEVAREYHATFMNGVAIPEDQDIYASMNIAKNEDGEFILDETGRYEWNDRGTVKFITPEELYDTALSKAIDNMFTEKYNEIKDEMEENDVPVKEEVLDEEVLDEEILDEEVLDEEILDEEILDVEILDEEVEAEEAEVVVEEAAEETADAE